jgi:hypothetical protein
MAAVEEMMVMFADDGPSLLTPVMDAVGDPIEEWCDRTE